MIYKTLDQQPSAIQFEVTDEKFGIWRSHLLGPSSATVYYAQMGDILLSKKRGVFAVTICSPTHVALVYVYSYDQVSAERFIDALETMRRAARMRAEPDARAAETQ